ncbi:MAG: SEC-C metal-binding domain-containing protein [Actinomycetota bacterium]
MGKRSRRRQRASRPLAPSRKEIRKLAEVAQQAAQEFLERATDPAVPPEEVAAEFVKTFGDRLPPDGFTMLIANKGSLERARAVADAALDVSDGCLGALVFAAEVAELEHDDPRCLELYEKAMELSDEPALKWCYGLSLHECGRLADAVEVAEQMSRDDPEDWSAHDTYRDVLVEVSQRIDEIAPREACPCGSGHRYKRCCLPRERAALGRFEDRSRFDELRELLTQYAIRPENRAAMHEAREAWFGDEEQVEADQAESQLFMEWSFRVALFDVPDSDDPDDARCLLQAFADDPSTPADAAHRAAEWAAHGRYVLWVVRDPRPRPHVWLRDILTGRMAWAQVAPSQAEALAPWTVLLGYVVPIDGIWRMGGAFLALTPREGDALARRALEIVDLVIRDALKRKKGPKPGPLADEFSELALSVALEDDPPFAGIEGTVSSILSQALPHLVSTVNEWRSAPPRLQNMDGNPLLFITATIDVDDAALLQQSMQDHPDFEAADDHIAWWGRELTPGEVAQARARLQEDGYEVEDDGRPQRWLRAKIKFRENAVVADVNSQARLDLLLDILEKLGAAPELIDETRFDPAQDLPLPPATAVPVRDVSASEDAAWRDTWLDESVPALEGLTPREAMGDEEGRIQLEALLRNFEYEAALAQTAGKRPMDVGALRAALGLDHPWSYQEVEDSRVSPS